MSVREPFRSFGERVVRDQAYEELVAAIVEARGDLGAMKKALDDALDFQRAERLSQHSQADIDNARRDFANFGRPADSHGPLDLGETFGNLFGGRRPY